MLCYGRLAGKEIEDLRRIRRRVGASRLRDYQIVVEYRGPGIAFPASPDDLSIISAVCGQALIYFIGTPTHVAVGTDLFEIVISAGFGTVTHALKGNVDILMALVMQTGAAIGAQIGATSTRFFAGPRIRLLFSFLPFIGAALVILRLVGVMGGH